MGVFDPVMTGRYVTRAAERLEITQSSVSDALNRLREPFEDELFEKSASCSHDGRRPAYRSRLSTKRRDPESKVIQPGHRELP
ncbi:LysR family transcriptional regulator [Burkholderia sp. JPY481]|uniref:LysR family transcriptional regulator n=1 Tax=Paraburkholderia sp. JPY465 TaxID=3042285 RepID=UPI00317230D6